MMTKDEYKQKQIDLEKKHQREKAALMREYCDANNPYKIDDIISSKGRDCIVQIKKIGYHYSFNDPLLQYTGIALKKDLTPKVRQNGETIFSSDHDIVKHN